MRPIICAIKGALEKSLLFERIAHLLQIYELGFKQGLSFNEPPPSTSPQTTAHNAVYTFGDGPATGNFGNHPHTTVHGAPESQNQQYSDQHSPTSDNVISKNSTYKLNLDDERDL